MALKLPAWLAWTPGTTVPILPTLPNIDTFDPGLPFLVLVYLYSLSRPSKFQRQGKEQKVTEQKRPLSGHFNRGDDHKPTDDP